MVRKEQGAKTHLDKIRNVALLVDTPLFEPSACSSPPSPADHRQEHLLASETELSTAEVTLAEGELKEARVPPRPLPVVERIAETAERLEEEVVPLELGCAAEPGRRVVGGAAVSRLRSAGGEMMLLNLDSVLEAGGHVEGLRVVEAAVDEKAVEVEAGMEAGRGGRWDFAGNVEEKDLLDSLRLLPQASDGVDG